MTKYYANATCGRNPNQHAEPCIKTSLATGKVTCSIKASTKKDGLTPTNACRTTTNVKRVACPAYTRCLEAADTNADLIIAAPGDDGMCVPTPTPTATGTPDSDPDCVAESLRHGARTHTPPDDRPDFGWDTVANPDGVTPIVVEGSIDNTAQAFWTDPRQCASDPAPSFHWVINTPNTVQYTARGITGYRTDTLGFEADSIPNFGQQTITFIFTITSQVPNPSGTFFSTTKSFKVSYRNSALTLSMSTTCQTMQQVGNACNIEAALAVLPGTPT